MPLPKSDMANEMSPMAMAFSLASTQRRVSSSVPISLVELISTDMTKMAIYLVKRQAHNETGENLPSFTEFSFFHLQSDVFNSS